MKKVTLLGDSIRCIGYGNLVPPLLGRDYEVWQPDDNCRFAKYTLRGMYDWRGNMNGSDVIHWNNGLWDICDILGDGKQFTDLDEYVTNMVRLGGILKKIAPRVIFATTTPVTDNNTVNSNAEIIRYNGALVPELVRLGIEINDLHAAVYPRRNELIRADDRIHLTDEGAQLCAKLVADAILKN